MKLGLLTAAFPETPLTEVADWSAANGFSMLEVACWPRGEGATRRYSGVSHIDCANLSDGEAKDLVADLADRGIEVSALGYYPNHLHPDPAHRAEVNGHLKHVIAAAAKMNVPVVNTFIGNDQHKSPKENFAEFTTVWPDLVRLAADHGVKIGIENCPMIFSDDEWPGGQNLMYAPAVWRERLRLPRRRHPRSQPRPLAPRLADDRLRAGGARVRGPHLSRAREGHGDRSERSL